jgi:drug/metabolite transporter (DMT)-like permease
MLNTPAVAIVRTLFGNAYVLLILTTASWAGNAVASRFAVGEISPMALTALRWVGVVLLVVMFARGAIARDWPVMRKHLGYLAALGALGFAAFNGLFYLAAQTTTAINLGIIQGAIPIFVLVGAFLAYRTPVTGIQAIGVAVTVCGVIIITAHGQFARLAALEFHFGDMLMLGACTMYAGYTVALRKRPPVSGLAMFSVMSIAALFASIPLVTVEYLSGGLQWPTLTGWIVLLYVVLFPSFLAQLFFMRGVELIGPGRAGVFVNLVPIFASIFSVVLLDEDFQTYHALALVFVLGGIGIAEWARRS